MRKNTKKKFFFYNPEDYKVSKELLLDILKREFPVELTTEKMLRPESLNSHSHKIKINEVIFSLCNKHKTITSRVPEVQKIELTTSFNAEYIPSKKYMRNSLLVHTNRINKVDDNCFCLTDIRKKYDFMLKQLKEDTLLNESHRKLREEKNSKIMVIKKRCGLHNSPNVTGYIDEENNKVLVSIYAMSVELAEKVIPKIDQLVSEEKQNILHKK